MQGWEQSWGWSTKIFVQKSISEQASGFKYARLDRQWQKFHLSGEMMNIISRIWTTFLTILAFNIIKHCCVLYMLYSDSNSLFAVHCGQLLCARACQQVCSPLHIYPALPKWGLATWFCWENYSWSSSSSLGKFRRLQRPAAFLDHRQWFCMSTQYFHIRRGEMISATTQQEQSISGWQDAFWGAGCSETFPRSLWSNWWCGLQVVNSRRKMLELWSCTERTSSSSWATLVEKK